MNRPQRSISIDEARVLRAYVEHAKGSLSASTPAPSYVVLLIELLIRDGVSYHDILESASITDAEVAIWRAESPSKLPPNSPKPAPAKYRIHPAPPPTQAMDMIVQHSFTLQSASQAESESIVTKPSSGDHVEVNRGRSVVLMLGDEGERHLHIEIEVLQRAIPLSYLRLHPQMRTRLEDVRDVIDSLTPTILHLAAHADREGVHLTDAAGRSIVAWEDFIREVERCSHRPDVVVPNACRSSDWADQFLQLGVRYVIAVDGEVPVECAWKHSETLYQSLGQYSLNRAIERARTAIRVGWPSVEYRVHRHVLATPEWYAPWALRQHLDGELDSV